MYYTKYRPQKFTDISKPNDVAMALMNQLSQHKTAHAYLFLGPRGTGKTTTARLLAKALNCEHLQKDGDPCDECAACMAVKSGSFVDLIEIDAASNRGIDDIRDLRDRVRLSPSKGKVKVYIIDEVHMLTTEAFNALLKTLEEPPSHAVFILCTTEFHKVPDTIKSRCQIFKFKHATVKQLVEKLEKICKEEDISSLSKADLEQIARAANGGFRDAENILQQIADGNLDTKTFLSLSEHQTHQTFVSSLYQNDSRAAIIMINRLYEDGIDLHVWTTELVQYLRQLLFVQNDCQEMLPTMTQETEEALHNTAKLLSRTSLSSYIEVFTEALSKLSSYPVQSLALELAVIKLISPADTSVKNNTDRTPQAPTGPDRVQQTVMEDDFGAIFDDTSESDTADESQPNTTTSDLSEPVIAFEEVSEKWKQLLKEALSRHTSMHALLRAAKPIDIKGATLIVEVNYDFHKERMETKRNREMIRNLLSEFYGTSLQVECLLNKENRPVIQDETQTGVLTDRNITPLGGQVTEESLMNFFDGGLPM